MLKVVFSPISEQDIEDHYVFIASENLTAAKKFFQSVQEMTKTISRMPQIGTVFSIQRDIPLEIRYLPISGFGHHLIFYKISGKTIRILRLLHSARDLNNIQDWW